MDDFSLRTIYYNTFLRTAEGRIVFNDMRKRAYNFFRGIGISGNEAAQLALDDFIASILLLCGIDGEQAELELLEKTAEVAGGQIAAKDKIEKIEQGKVFDD